MRKSRRGDVVSGTDCASCYQTRSHFSSRVFLQSGGGGRFGTITLHAVSPAWVFSFPFTEILLEPSPLPRGYSTQSPELRWGGDSQGSPPKPTQSSRSGPRKLD